MSVLRECGAEPIPGYRLIEPLGSGGFGEAWKCEAPGGIYKAIKFVFGNLNSLDDGDAARAEQELQALHRVKEVRHPFVLGMDRIEILDGELVIVMELADKNLFDVYVEAQSAGLVGIPRDQLISFIRDSAEALDYMCEKHGLQHLDIKPRNLFLVSDRVKVADFGLVKHLERSGMSGILGGVTPLYASPETFTGKFSDRSDQYSLAIVYQELLTAQRPFNGKNARMLAHQHMNEAPELRSLPEAERPIIARALSKDPAKRFPNCLSFVRALYTARSAPTRLRDSEEGQKANRPKTLYDTMEDIHLEQMVGKQDELEEVDLGGSLEELDEVSNLGLTAHLPQTGALRPALIIGLGSLGRRALMELRCRLLDRFGDLERVPIFRFLYIDTDADALRQACRGASEIAFKPDEVYHLPLQPIAHYRQRQMAQLSEWLPPQKLYTLPRNLKTQGSRALGRLAFSDNYLRLVARIKRELQAVSHPDALYRAVNDTGLALRDNIPCVSVIASASGGSSGFLPDLGYALKRVLKQMRQPEGHINSFLFCGAPDDPATPPAEQANLYATLTELNHFAEGMAPFSAQYGADGARIREEGPAFEATYLLTHAQRSPGARRDAVAHLGSYLFHELTTPLGLQLERWRIHTNGVAFRSIGTHAVWFPSGLLLRLAARRALKTLVQHWTTMLEAPTGTRGVGNYSEVEAVCGRILSDPDLRPEALTTQLETLAANHLDETTPSAGLVQFLSQLEEQCWQFGGPDDPGVWARQAVGRMKEWLGGGVQQQGSMSVGLRKSRITRALESAYTTLAETWDKKLAEAVLQLMDVPGHRIAMTEAALGKLIQWCGSMTEAQLNRVRDLNSKAAQAELPLQEALRTCINGNSGWSFFTNRRSRPLRLFLDHLATHARQSLTADIATALLQFYHALQGRLRDQLRDCTFVRQRLRAVVEVLEMPPLEDMDDEMSYTPEMTLSPTPLASTESFWEVLRESTTTRVVLPDGEKELDRAAGRFVSTLTPEHWVHLDQNLQEFVFSLQGGMNKLCLAASDVQRHLATPLVDQAARCLQQFLPVTDVAQVELCLSEDGHEDLPRMIQTSYERAIPLIAPEAPQKRDSKVLALAGLSRASLPEMALEGGQPRNTQTCFLLIPGSEHGKVYGDEAQKVIHGVHLVRVPGKADLMFCREQGNLTPAELRRMLTPCRAAYEEALYNINNSPHARFDTQDWVPLEP